MVPIRTGEDCRITGGPAAKALKIVGMVILGIIAAAALAIVFGLAIKWLWNTLMPDVFGLPEIGYWQAVGLVVLSHILFGSHHHCDHSKDSKKKGTVVDRQGNRLYIDHHHHPDDCSGKHFDSFREFWNDHGSEAFDNWLNGRRKEEGE